MLNVTESYEEVIVHQSSHQCVWPNFLLVKFFVVNQSRLWINILIDDFGRSRVVWIPSIRNIAVPVRTHFGKQPKLKCACCHPQIQIFLELPTEKVCVVDTVCTCSEVSVEVLSGIRWQLLRLIWFYEDLFDYWLASTQKTGNWEYYFGIHL